MLCLTDYFRTGYTKTSRATFFDSLDVCFILSYLLFIQQYIHLSLHYKLSALWSCENTKEMLRWTVKKNCSILTKERLKEDLLYFFFKSELFQCNVITTG